jgi:thioester reductase-like protein
VTHSLSAPRTFLLTGVTGFLGKVLLEELVRRKGELGVERIGVVIRPMRGSGPRSDSGARSRARSAFRDCRRTGRRWCTVSRGISRSRGSASRR